MSKSLQQVTNNRNNSLQQIELLNNKLYNQKSEIEELKQQLIEASAKNTIDEVITVATDHIVALNTKDTQTEFGPLKKPPEVNVIMPEELQQGSLPTFQWPSSQGDTASQNFFEQPVTPTQKPFAFQGRSQTSLPSSLLDVESQIVSPEDVLDVANNKKALQEIEFEKVDPILGAQNKPIIEELVKPKQAYLTYQSGAEAFGENDDGWGWGPEEARLEEEHQHEAESTPQMQNLRQELAHALEDLQVLQLERENHLEEIKQLQVKSGKLIKKCKELKAQNDKLIVQKSGKNTSEEFFDLNDAIQEELKSQITQLEKRIKELTAELDKERIEKKHILNRVDVLTAANERMLEMKEIQDTEVLRWKRKFEGNEEKLQQYEWGSDGFSERPSPKQPKGKTFINIILFLTIIAINIFSCNR